MTATTQAGDIEQAIALAFEAQELLQAPALDRQGLAARIDQLCWLLDQPWPLARAEGAC